MQQIVGHFGVEFKSKINALTRALNDIMCVAHKMNFVCCSLPPVYNIPRTFKFSDTDLVIVEFVF